jgi:hypothetical protein
LEVDCDVIKVRRQTYCSSLINSELEAAFCDNQLAVSLVINLVDETGVRDPPVALLRDRLVPLLDVD